MARAAVLLCLFVPLLQLGAPASAFGKSTWAILPTEGCEAAKVAHCTKVVPWIAEALAAQKSPSGEAYAVVFGGDLKKRIGSPGAALDRCNGRLGCWQKLAQRAKAGHLVLSRWQGEQLTLRIFERNSRRVTHTLEFDVAAAESAQSLQPALAARLAEAIAPQSGGAAADDGLSGLELELVPLGPAAEAPAPTDNQDSAQTESGGGGMDDDPLALEELDLAALPPAALEPALVAQEPQDSSNATLYAVIGLGAMELGALGLGYYWGSQAQRLKVAVEDRSPGNELDQPTAVDTKDRQFALADRANKSFIAAGIIGAGLGYMTYRLLSNASDKAEPRAGIGIAPTDGGFWAGLTAAF